MIAPADPLRGLTSDADYRRSIVQSMSGPVLLVGHSYGGAVITDAATGADNVVGLVYVGAFIPAEGTSVATSYDPAKYPGSLLGQDSLLVRPVANAAAPGGMDADLYIKVNWFRRVFAGDQTRATAGVMAASQRPLSAFAFSEPPGLRASGLAVTAQLGPGHAGRPRDLPRRPEVHGPPSRRSHHHDPLGSRRHGLASRCSRPTHRQGGSEHLMRSTGGEVGLEQGERWWRDETTRRLRSLPQHQSVPGGVPQLDRTRRSGARSES